MRMINIKNILLPLLLTAWLGFGAHSHVYADDACPILTGNWQCNTMVNGGDEPVFTLFRFRQTQDGPITHYNLASKKLDAQPGVEMTHDHFQTICSDGTLIIRFVEETGRAMTYTLTRVPVEKLKSMNGLKLFSEFQSESGMMTRTRFDHPEKFDNDTEENCLLMPWPFQ